jgi:hypothetical protein
MTDDLPAVVPPVPAVPSMTPASEVPAGESNIPTPTAEQQAIADRVFTDPHPAATLLGVLTSAMLLRDVAIDTFVVSGEDEEAEEQPDKPANGRRYMGRGSN